jgi:hypothetical protein
MDNKYITNILNSLKTKNFIFENELLATKNEIQQKIEELKSLFNKYEELNKIKDSYNKRHFLESGEKSGENNENIEEILSKILKLYVKTSDISGIDNNVNLYTLDDLNKLSENKVSENKVSESVEEKLNKLNYDEKSNISGFNIIDNLYKVDDSNNIMNYDLLLDLFNRKNKLLNEKASLEDKILELLNNSNYKIPVPTNKIDFTKTVIQETNINSNLISPKDFTLEDKILELIYNSNYKIPVPTNNIDFTKVVIQETNINSNLV